jgi:hypothetical protein
MNSIVQKHPSLLQAEKRAIQAGYEDYNIYKSNEELTQVFAFPLNFLI